MTKAAQIMALHAQGKTTREIAIAVMGLDPEASWAERDKKMAYVRVVVRQRKEGKQSPSNLRWTQSSAGRDSHQRAAQKWRQANPGWFKSRYWSDPAFRERSLARSRESYRRKREMESRP